MANAIEQIYQELTQVFGSSNPNQIFSMMFPRTTLDSKTFSYDVEKIKPATVEEVESKFAVQMFCISMGL